MNVKGGVRPDQPPFAFRRWSGVEPTPEGEIRARIAEKGKITFAEFVEVALYHEAGYYSSRAHPVADGDYYTSAQAHPAFGALVSVVLSRMWELLERPGRFDAIEMGAGGGQLARDVARYAPNLPGPFNAALGYVALDRFPVKPPPDGPSPAYQSLAASGTPLKGMVGCLLSNELVDAMPVHRFKIDQGSIKEVYVSVHEGRFVDVLDEPSTPELARRLGGFGLRLPEGYRGEVNLQVGPWMAGVATSIQRGFILTIDYGHEATDLYASKRSFGTVQTYYEHTSGRSPYGRVGLQDITAQVDFSSLASAGEAAGLRTVGMCTQAEFLSGLGIQQWLRTLRTEPLTQRERDANMMAMRELVEPDGFGGFKVLVQEKGTGVTDIGQLFPLMSTADGAGPFPVPLLGREHLPLIDGRYPHAGWQMEELWPQAEVNR